MAAPSCGARTAAVWWKRSAARRTAQVGRPAVLQGRQGQRSLVFPANSPALLAKFPPTLLITGNRDFTMSSVLHSQALLTAAGVNTELHVWDGMWHSFFSDPECPNRARRMP